MRQSSSLGILPAAPQGPRTQSSGSRQIGHHRGGLRAQLPSGSRQGEYLLGETHLFRARPDRAAETAACTAGILDPPPSSSTASSWSAARPVRASTAAGTAATLWKKSPARASKSALRHAHACQLGGF